MKAHDINAEVKVLPGYRLLSNIRRNSYGNFSDQTYHNQGNIKNCEHVRYCRFD